MFRKFGGRIVFIGISREDKAKLANFVKKFHVTFFVAQDGDGSIFSAFDARIPTHILVDREGIIRYSEPVPPDPRDLERVLR
jgi:peroxiredoxin